MCSMGSSIGVGASAIPLHSTVKLQEIDYSAQFLPLDLYRMNVKP